jgi:hypothetical protein
LFGSFSRREAVSTSLEKALVNTSGNNAQAAMRESAD